MRWTRIRAHDVGVLPDLDIDLDALPGELIALAGENGAGKSTFLGCLAAALWRELPTRGALLGLARSREAFVEATVEHAGRTYRLRQNVDPVNGKSEALLTDADTGEVLVTSGKVRDVDAYVATRFPSRDVVLASLFAPQGSTGFLGMPPAEARAVVLRALGIEAIEKRAKRARDHAAAAKTKLGQVAARMLELKNVDPVGLDMLRGERAATAERATAAEYDLVAARDELTRMQQSAGAADAVRIQRAAAVRRAEAAHSALEDLDKRIANNFGIISRTNEIRAAVAREAIAQRELTAAREVYAGHDRDKAAATATRDGHTRDERAAADRMRWNRKQAEEATERLAGGYRERVEAAIAGLPEAQAAVDAARAAAKAVGEALAALQDERHDGAEQRIEGLRTGLTEIVEHEEQLDAVAVADHTLVEDDKLRHAIAALPGRLAAGTAARDAAERDLALAEKALRTVENLAAELPTVERREAELRIANEETDLAQKAWEAATAAFDTCNVNVAALDMELLGDAQQIRQLSHELEALAPVTSQASRLDAAEGRLAELTPQRVAALAEHEAAAEALAGIAEPGPDPDFRPIRDTVARLEREARDVRASVGALDERLAIAERDVERGAELREQIRATETELADWTLAAEALGPTGVQALEIDAAGPELSDAANALLHECFGTRWTVSFETTRASADGKRSIETLEIRVLDTERGTDGDSARLSGGEAVVVGEAVALALAQVAMRRAGGGSTGHLLIRDESGAALDEKNRDAYVRMLRLGARAIGAGHVLLVSHSADVVAACDAALLFADGRVRVCSPAEALQARTTTEAA